jgi:hypothetical protein
MDNILDIDSIVNSAGRINLSDKEMNLLYAYLDMELDDMSDEDKAFWYEILNKIDPDEE